MSRITVVTGGHLATCPRMTKAANTLAGAGYAVHVISTRYLDWADEVDATLARDAKWSWKTIDFDRSRAPLRYLASGMRNRAAFLAATRWGASWMSWRWAGRAFGRYHAELAREIRRRPADLVYAGTSGALAAAAEAALAMNVPYALDLEDFHSAQQLDSPRARTTHALAERIERAILGGAAFLTAASPLIAAEYARKYSIACPGVLHNVFPLPAEAPDFRRAAGPLRLYWFSQTVGPQRGLEDAVRALGQAGFPAELHLRGKASETYLAGLREFARAHAPQTAIHHHPPAADPIGLARGYDIGLALEQGYSFNNSIARSNKAFSYMLAGLAIVFTDTPGQHGLAVDLGEAAFAYPPGDTAALAAGLKRWSDDRDALLRGRQAAWNAAVRRWRWDHAEESGTLLALVRSAGQPRGAVNAG